MCRKLIITISLFFISFSAYSTSVWHTSEIERVYPLADGSFVITFKENSVSCTNANNPKYHYVIVGQNGMTVEGIQLMFSAALSAAVSGKPVTINFDSSGNSCYVNRLYIQY